MTHDEGAESGFCPFTATFEAEKVGDWREAKQAM
jgi:hypothetical protein